MGQTSMAVVSCIAVRLKYRLGGRETASFNTRCESGKRFDFTL